ncbi:hypothetical protein V7S43_015193 [Phytophthora oleae]|uniref:Uncharacterized protein n=1 Tax=Phytophthora oleae TaxID=2107226 RepID=A0ABD3F2L7_9STRA
MTIFSWVFLFLLPPQKTETQALVRKGGHSKLIGGATTFYLIFAIIWSIMTNIMAMFDSTSCLIIAGGTGCKRVPLAVGFFNAFVENGLNWTFGIGILLLLLCFSWID